MNRSAIERNYERINTNVLFREYPIHYSGAALIMVNDSATLTATISLDDSADGATWTPILFSTHTQSGLLNITMQPHAYATILFRSTAQFVRVTTTPTNPEGVFVHLVQWPPVSKEVPSEY